MKVKITQSLDYTTPFSAAENDKDLEKITRLKYAKACSNLCTDAGFFAHTIDGIKEYESWRLVGYDTFEEFCKNELGKAIDEVEAIVIGVKMLGGVATEAEAKKASRSAKAAQMVKDEGITLEKAGELNGGISRQAVHKASTKNLDSKKKVDTPNWMKGMSDPTKAMFRKLPKDLQDKAAKKEISVRGAAIKAGIIKVETPVEKVVNAFKKLSYDDQKQAVAQIDDIWDKQ